VAVFLFYISMEWHRVKSQYRRREIHAGNSHGDLSRANFLWPEEEVGISAWNT